MDRKTTEDTCRRLGVDAAVPDAASKVGVALQTLAHLLINGVRLAPQGDTCGWYLWGGGDIGREADFFQPLHVAQLERYCPMVLPYLGLPPGWAAGLGPSDRSVAAGHAEVPWGPRPIRRFQVAPGHEDVWFEPLP